MELYLRFVIGNLIHTIIALDNNTNYTKFNQPPDSLGR